MADQKLIGPELLTAAAALARVPLRLERLQSHMDTLTPLLAEIDALRALPLKDCEPPLVFQPIEA